MVDHFAVDYRKLYYYLFNQITRALDEMEALNFGQAGKILRNAQMQAEETYLESGEVECTENA